MSNIKTIPPLYIFFDHFDDSTTIVFDGWIKINCQTSHVDDRNDVFETYEVPKTYQNDIDNALLGNVKPFDLTEVKNLDTMVRNEIAAFVYECITNEKVVKTDALRQLLIETKDAEYIYFYLRDVDRGDAEMRQALIDSGILYWAILYCRDIGIDQEFRQIVIDSKNPFWAYYYCQQVGCDTQMQQMILNAANPKWAYEYCKNVANDADMRQVVLDAANPRWAYEYCLDVSDDADMRQIIIDSGDPKYAFWYCAMIKNSKDMRQVIVDAGDPEWAYMYCRDVEEDAEMRQVIVESQNYF